MLLLPMKALLQTLRYVLRASNLEALIAFELPNWKLQSIWFVMISCEADSFRLLQIVADLKFHVKACESSALGI